MKEIMVIVYPASLQDYNILRTILKWEKVTRLPRGICLLMPRSGLSLYYIARLMKALSSRKLTVKWVEETLWKHHIPPEVWSIAEKQKLSRSDVRRLSRSRGKMI